MARLLRVKKAIQEYFYKPHPTNERKLTANEKVVTSKVRSFLDPMAEVTARTQGGAGGFLSPSIVEMAELLKLLEDETQNVRAGGSEEDCSPAVDKVDAEDPSPEAQVTRQVLIDTMQSQKLGEVSTSTERIACAPGPAVQALPQRGGLRQGQRGA